MNFIPAIFGELLSWLYNVTSNYGLAMIIFAIAVKVILMPITAKSKKSMMKMSRLQPKIQEIQRKYADDKQKQNEAIQKLQQEEGASMGCGGCLWSLLPLLILIPLYDVIRYPLQYLLDWSAEEIKATVEAVEATGVYAELQAAYLSGSIDFHFLGINLGDQPSFNIFAESWKWDWAHIGLMLIPILSATSAVLSMVISQKMNNSVVTDEKGLQDKETAEKSQAAQSSKMMMWISPIMSLWIGFSCPGALSLYWFIQGVVSIIIDVILTKKYRKFYDKEDAERLKRALEEEAAEAERERIRAEKRAANPDGITANTSKKKLQQRKNEEAEAARAEAAKEYAAKKGIAQDDQEEEKPLSGDAQRPYCKGRAYDPHRYDSTEEE